MRRPGSAIVEAEIVVEPLGCREYAGGELFLLKHVNRKRFEKMRTRFERQEFLAMTIADIRAPEKDRLHKPAVPDAGR